MTKQGSTTETFLLLMSTRTYRASAFMDAARLAGAGVVVGSERAQALSPLNPAGHLTLDLSSHASLERIVAFARERPLAAIVAADDEGAVLAAHACERLGLRHHPAAAVEAALDKHRSRMAFRAAGCPTPECHLVGLDADPRTLATRIDFPSVVKPTSMSASRGVIRADDAAEFAAAFARAAAIVRGEPGARPMLLVESFIRGTEVTVEGLMDRGEFVPLALFDKPDPLDGPFFEETIYVTPSRLSRGAQAAVFDMTSRAVAALGLAHGPVHAELRINEEGIWPLEIAPRSIGGLCSRALRFEPGRSLEEILLDHALGRLATRPALEAAASGVMMIPIPRAGRLRAVRGVKAAAAIDAIEDVRITIPIGERLVPLPEGGRYLGFVFARAETTAEAERAIRDAHRLLEFDIEAEYVA